MIKSDSLFCQMLGLLLETKNSLQFCGSKFIGIKSTKSVEHDFLQWVAKQLFHCSAATMEIWFLFADEWITSQEKAKKKNNNNNAQ